MALIKTLEDLEDWTEYRKFVVSAFKSMKGESQFFVSKDDFDFDVKGKPWPGRVALFGDKGAAAMAALKREGMQFRSGTCTEADGDLQVTGVSAALLKLVNKTFKKLPVGGKAKVAGAESDDDDDENDAKDSRDSGPDKKVLEATQKLKAAVAVDLKKAVASKPDNRAALIAAYSKAEKLEKKDDHAGAQKILAALQKQLQKQLAGAASDASAADKLKDKVKAKKAGLRSDLTEVLTKKPANQGAIAKLVKKAGEQEKAGEWQAALDSLTELEDEIVKAEAAGDGADDDADAAVLQDMAAKQKTNLVKRAKQVLAQDPTQREPISRILKEADKHEKKADYEAQVEQYEELEELLDSVAPIDEDDEDLELNSIENWQDYRKWMRARFKRLPKNPAAAEPFYISRKKMAFDLGGRKWRGHAVIGGKKARALAKELKKSGLLLLQGACYAEGKVLHVSGMSSAALKAAGKTLKLLKLGYTLEAAAGDAGGPAAEEGAAPQAAAFAKRRAALEADLQSVLSQGLGDTSRIRATDAFAQESADNGNWEKAVAGLVRLEKLVAEAASGPAETDVISAGLVEYRKSLVKFASAKTAALGQLATLKSGISGVPDQSDLADALSSELKVIFDDVANVVDAAINASKDDAAPVTAAVRSEVDRAFSELGANALLDHIEASPWGVSIKKPLLNALTGIRSAMPA